MSGATAHRPGDEVGITPHSLRHVGDARPLTVLRVATTAGFTVDVLPDRGLDLGAAAIRGLPVAWLSGAPLRHPANLPRNEWGARFVGGLLATCGLDNVGPACWDAGRVFPQHGRIGGEPACGVRWGTRRLRGQMFHWIAGEVAQPDSGLRLRRHILIPNADAGVCVRDVVVNTGRASEPLMLQYHCNFGAPFVAPGGRVVVPGTSALPRDADAVVASDRWSLIEPAREGEPGRVCRHQQSGQGWVASYLAPPPDGLASPWVVRLHYDRRTLPWLWQWRVLTPAAYVIGLEPANCAVKPRDEARRRDALPMLEPGGQVRFALRVALLRPDPSEGVVLTDVVAR